MNTKSEKIFIDALIGAGYRLTKQRRAVCAYLANTDTHPTPYDVFAEISHSHPEISRATVYNTLNLLKQLGVITEISLGDDHARYETDINPHVNLICLRCHSVTDYAEAPPVDTLYTQIQEQTGFYPVTSQTEVLGFCQECRAKRRSEIVGQWESQQGAKKSESEESGSTQKARTHDTSTEEEV